MLATYPSCHFLFYLVTAKVPSEWCMNVMRVYHRTSIKNLLALNGTYYLYYNKYCTEFVLFISAKQCYLVCNVLSASEPGFGDRQWRTEVGFGGFKLPKLTVLYQCYCTCYI